MRQTIHDQLKVDRGLVIDKHCSCREFRAARLFLILGRPTCHDYVLYGDAHRQKRKIVALQPLKCRTSGTQGVVSAG